ncbi:hypothetical protein [Streptacidiphilus sp. EB103A]|uniref:Cap15 family cyclic dinucleotide receptor domain-containing protein n=1 Tax=Streptacidiphilus sp. EB103A TaxID=3156275 RepID=UPI00351149AE
MANIRQQVSIGIAALVWLVLALLTGQNLSPTPLKIYSIAGTAATIVFLFWDRFIWRWKAVRFFTGVPLVHGTWRGELISSYIRPDGTAVAPIPTILFVSQTASNVTVTLFTGESKSVSENAKLACDPDGRWRLTWQYVNNPRPAVRGRSERHHGAAETYLGTQAGEGLEGEYFTDRKTDGELIFKEWSPKRYGNAESGLAGTDFKDAQPFARES